MTADAGTAVVVSGTRARKRWRWLLGLVTVAVLIAVGATLAMSSSSDAVQTRVKPLDRNVWIVHGRIEPDEQTFCARDISAIVPVRDALYVICDSRGRVEATSSPRSEVSP